MLQAIRAYCQSTAQPVPESVGDFARCCFESLSLSYWSTRDALQSLTSARFAPPRRRRRMPQRIPLPDDIRRLRM